MQPLLRGCFLGALVAFVGSAEQGGCPAGLGNCSAQDEDSAALLQRSTSTHDSLEALGLNPDCMKCFPKSPTLMVKDKFLQQTFGGVVDFVNNATPDDLYKQKQLFDIPYCGGMETVAEVYSKKPMVLITASGLPSWIDNNWWTGHHWWCHETVLDKTMTPKDYSNKVIAVPYTPLHFVKCTFSPMKEFYVGSGAARLTDRECGGYNTKSSKAAGLEIKGVCSYQDPHPSVLQMYIEDPLQHVNKSDCVLCDVNLTMPIKQQLTAANCQAVP